MDRKPRPADPFKDIHSIGGDIARRISPPSGTARSGRVFVSGAPPATHSANTSFVPLAPRSTNWGFGSVVLGSLYRRPRGC